jgi:hypothetical protein
VAGSRRPVAMRGKLGLRSRFYEFSPTDISGLTGWWDASDPSTLFDATSGGSAVAADGSVARLEDKSGNGRHFTQSTSGSRPVRKTSVQNSRDVIRFDGSDHWLDSSIQFQALFTASASTCFVVAKADTATTFNLRPDIPGVLHETQSVHGFFCVRNVDTVQSYGYDTTYKSVEETYEPGGWILLTTWHDGTDLRVAINADAAVSVGMGSRSILDGTMRMAASWNQGHYFDGDVGEILAYNQTLSQSDRESVQTALISKWGI